MTIKTGFNCYSLYIDEILSINVAKLEIKILLITQLTEYQIINKKLTIQKVSFSLK